MPQELPAFPCPCCHERTFEKRSVENDAPVTMGTVLTHLHLCHACGENYLSTVHVSPDRLRTEVWDYYLDRLTPLRRVRHYEPSGAHGLRETASEFLIGAEHVSETAWRSALATARTTPSPLVEAPASTFAERWLAWWAKASHPYVPSFRLLPAVHTAAHGRQAA